MKINQKKLIREISPLLTENRKQRIQKVINYKTLEIGLIIEKLYDFGNVQALLRTAEGLGLLELAYIPFPDNMKYRQHSRISKGTKKWLIIRKFDNIKNAIDFYKTKNYKIICTSLQGNKSFYELDFSHKLIFILGNELEGASKDAHKYSDEIIYFPMKGFVDSFNVSVAGAIFLHHSRFMKEKILKQNINLPEDYKEKLKAFYYYNSLHGKNKNLISEKFGIKDIIKYLEL